MFVGVAVVRGDVVVTVGVLVGVPVGVPVVPGVPVAVVLIEPMTRLLAWTSALAPARAFNLLTMDPSLLETSTSSKIASTSLDWLRNSFNL